MKKLRREGWSFRKIAAKIGCDKRSVFNYIKKYNISTPKKIVSIKGHVRIMPKTKKGKCTSCGLLLKSKYYCELCEPLKNSIIIDSQKDIGANSQ